MSHSPCGRCGGMTAGLKHLLAPESLPPPNRLLRRALRVQRGSDLFPQLALAFRGNLRAGHAGRCHEVRMLLHECDQQFPLASRDVRAQSYVFVGRHYGETDDRARRQRKRKMSGRSARNPSCKCVPRESGGCSLFRTFSCPLVIRRRSAFVSGCPCVGAGPRNAARHAPVIQPILSSARAWNGRRDRSLCCSFWN